MKAVATLLGILPVMSRTQRVLLGVGGVLLAVGTGFVLLVVPDPYRWRAVAGVAAFVIGVFVVLPTVAMTGVVVRVLSAPRATRLLPRFRVRMLAAAGLVIGLGTLALAVSVAVAISGRPAADMVAVVLVVLLGASLGFVGVYAAVASTAALLVALVGLAGLMSAIEQLPLRVLAEPAGLGTTATAVVLLWAAFATVYLRARHIAGIGPHLSLRGGDWGAASPRALDTTRAGAFHVVVTGVPRRAFARQCPAMIAGGALLYAVFRFLLWPDGPAGLDAAIGGMLALPFVGGLVACLSARRFVHRARGVWLHVAGSRRAVFREVERTASRWIWSWLLVLATVLVCALAFGPARAFEPLATLAALAAAGAVYGHYAGLAAVDDRHGLAIALLAALLASQLAVVGPLALERAPIGIAAAVVTGQGLVAVAVRAAALRRWRRVDWTALGPARTVVAELWPRRRSA